MAYGQMGERNVVFLLRSYVCMYCCLGNEHEFTAKEKEFFDDCSNAIFQVLRCCSSAYNAV